jgi:rRNA processing protein Gar1
MSVAVPGRVGELGLDGKLRVILPPIDLRVAEALTFRGGADVVTPRGEGIGRVDTIVGTLEHPVALVRLYDEAKRSASALAGKEVFLG